MFQSDSLSVLPFFLPPNLLLCVLKLQCFSADRLGNHKNSLSLDNLQLFASSGLQRIKLLDIVTTFSQYIRKNQVNANVASYESKCCTKCKPSSIVQLTTSSRQGGDFDNKGMLHQLQELLKLQNAMGQLAKF